MEEIARPLHASLNQCEMGILETVYPEYATCHFFKESTMIMGGAS